eukprot:scaffold84322_cov63-Phaeocystis_antarctica.AAC.4
MARGGTRSQVRWAPQCVPAITGTRLQGRSKCAHTRVWKQVGRWTGYGQPRRSARATQPPRLCPGGLATRSDAGSAQSA